MTAENRKGMKNTGTSNVSHALRKPLQCIDVTTPVAGHVVEVTFQNHCDAYDLFSDTTRLYFSLFSGGKIMLYSNLSCSRMVCEMSFSQKSVTINNHP